MPAWRLSKPDTQITREGRDILGPNALAHDDVHHLVAGEAAVSRGSVTSTRDLS